MSKAEAKLAACKATRKLAADALLTALRELLSNPEPISEVRLRDRWLEEMRASSDVYEDGWYMPPPHGMAVLFSSDQDVNRTNFDALRAPEMWARDDIFHDRTRGIIMVYASPVDRATHTIGDFEMILYFGKSQPIRDHFANALNLDYELFRKVTPGMTLAEITDSAESLMKSSGIENNVLSLNDPTGTNIGHTIPATNQDWTAEEKAIFEQNDWSKSSTTIATKRRFVNRIETLKAHPGLGFTIEPRTMVAGRVDIPMASFHTTVLMHENGEKELLTNFDGLFEIAGMDYMPTLADF